ncbi:dephospho-CoA kinase [Microscilla marina]|uniref:Dephospho-CoA kinase n=1 Tax=Microscilla marina ATCC 23134 TaxID=313606 RepID=A1ZKP5_MICM2|nr:dephospho-CoA kinase [Microscilla marina]EAY28861.1 dephospho-CoA kinase [Microscilla marina ATCC 23134]
MSKKKILKIGITGGIGSGKSIICRIFGCVGVPIYDADSRARWIMNNHQALQQEVTAEFGTEAYDSQGQLNRPYMAKQVFNDSNKVKTLNQLVHPKVGQDFAAWVQLYPNAPYLLKEAALMFESGSHQALDRVITVFAPKDVRIKRVLQRDPQRSEEQVKAIFGKQLAEEEKIKRADFVVYNDDQQMVLPQVLRLHEQFLNL